MASQKVPTFHLDRNIYFINFYSTHIFWQEIVFPPFCETASFLRSSINRTLRRLEFIHAIMFFFIT